VSGGIEILAGLEPETQVALLALGLSAAANVLLMVLNYFEHRAAERRGFAEFAISQRFEAATELVASLTVRMQLWEEAIYWRDQVRNHQASVDFELRQKIEGKLTEVLARHPPANERMSRAMAAAHVLFSESVIEAAGRVVFHANSYSEDAWPFDTARAQTELRAVATALREDLMVDEVTRYQDRLFRKRRRAKLRL
jgi:hypothetical protein